MPSPFLLDEFIKESKNVPVHIIVIHHIYQEECVVYLRTGKNRGGGDGGGKGE
jgi:hypothetical protein